MDAANATPAAKLRELANSIRTEPRLGAAIAEGFGIIADAMDPCTDCGHKTDPDPEELVQFIGGDDAPDAGQGAEA